MKRWDLLLALAIVCTVAAAVAVDWRLGVALLGLELAAVWYWLGEEGGDDATT